MGVEGNPPSVLSRDPHAPTLSRLLGHRTPAVVAPPGFSRGVLVGLTSIAVFTGFKLAFMEEIGAPTPFLLYFGAVLAAAWYGGFGAGMLSTLLGAVLGYGLFTESSVQHPISGAVLAQTGLFFVEGSIIALVTSRLQLERLQRARSAAAASAAAAQLATVMTGVDDGITMQDSEGRLIYANQAGARLCGFDSVEEFLRTPPERIVAAFEMIAEDGSPLTLAALPARELLQSGATSREMTVGFRVRKSGDLRWAVVRANAVKDESGATQFVVNVFRDITENRRRDELERINREWFATALRSIGDAVVTTDDRGNVSFLNPVAEALTGWSTEEAAGRPLREVFNIVHETTRAPAANPVDRVLREGVVVGLANHTILVAKDGTERAIDDSAAPIKTSAGLLVGVILVFRDVSVERRKDARKAFLMRATAELNSSLDYEGTLRTVARLAVPAIADWCAVDVVTPAGVKRLAVAHVDPKKIEFVRDVERQYPPDPNAATGVPNILRTGESEMLAEIPAQLLDAAAKNEEHLRLIRALSLRSYMGVPIKHGGKTLGAITFVMAESNRRYDQEDLATAIALGERAAVAIENASLYREVEQASRAKDDFLAMLGHELRNPLAPIVTALELMRTKPDAAHPRALSIIERQVKHLVRLVDDLLDVSRIAQGKVALDKERLEMRELVARAIEISEPLLAERRHQITTDVAQDLVVHGDSVRLSQVIANLLNNAAKYTEPGGHIAVSAREFGGDIEIRVKDDGMGIAPDMLPRVFDLFTQERQTIDRSQGGLGLGLAIVRSIVKLHGGSVEAHSAGAGQGSEFVIRLPRSASDPAPRGEVQAAAAAGKRTDVGHRVLIVDDNQDALELMALSLEHAGYVPLTASDGEEALALAARERPDVALVDIGLPVMDGYALAQQLRQVPGLSGIKLIALTGYGQPSDRSKSGMAGFDRHLIKPAPTEAVRDAIEGLLRS